MSEQRFTVTEEHVKLLRAANVSWNGIEWGAPTIDGKRPYGNGDLLADLTRILGGDLSELNAAELCELRDLHESTETALQIFLATGEMKPGEYRASKYGRDWELVP